MGLWGASPAILQSRVARGHDKETEAPVLTAHPEKASHRARISRGVMP